MVSARTKIHKINKLKKIKESCKENFNRSIKNTKIKQNKILDR